MKYGVKLVEFKGDLVDLWVFDGRKQLTFETMMEAQREIDRLRSQNPTAVYRFMVIPETDPQGDNVFEDVFAPKGFRYKDGLHTRAVHSEIEAELALDEEVEPCPEWCSCKSRQRSNYRKPFTKPFRATTEYVRAYRQ